MLLKRSTLYLVVVFWLILAATQPVFNDRNDGLSWVHAILYIGLSLGLVGLLLAHSVVYLRGRARIKRAGGRFFTARFVKWFLVSGWVLSVLYRFATFDSSIPVLASSGPFLFFSAGLLAYLIHWLVRRVRVG